MSVDSGIHGVSLNVYPIGKGKLLYNFFSKKFFQQVCHIPALLIQAVRPQTQTLS